MLQQVQQYIYHFSQRQLFSAVFTAVLIFVSFLISESGNLAGSAFTYKKCATCQTELTKPSLP